MRRIIAIIILASIIPFVGVGYARMNSLTEDDMGEMTGQVGITIDLTWQLEDSYLAWTDDDGFGTTGSYSLHTGVLTLDKLQIDHVNETTGDREPIEMTGLTLDVGTNGSSESYLLLGLPAISGQITVNEFYIGPTLFDRNNPPDPGQGYGGSLGRVFIGDLNLVDSQIRITGH